MNIKIERMASYLFCIGCALIALFLVGRYLLPILLPFVIAYFCVALTKGVAEKVHQKTGIPESFLRVFILIFSILLLFFVFVGLFVCLAKEAEELLLRWGKDSVGIGRALLTCRTSLCAFFEKIDASGVLADTCDTLFREGTSFFLSLLSGVAKNVFFALPRACVFLLITLIAALYFALDLPRVRAFGSAIFPDAYKARGKQVTDVLKNCLFRYARAYSILAGMTFFILWIGLFAIGIRYAILSAALLTFFDLLPVFGVGCALVPWGFFEIAIGNSGHGFALLLLFVLLFTLRQILEPKIVGIQMGLHPLASLFFTYAGLRLFGIGGMILMPIAAAVIREILYAQIENKGIKKRR